MKVTIHLTGGTTIEDTAAYDGAYSDPSPEDLADELLEELVNLTRPSFMRIGSTVFHTQAVTGIHIDTL